MNGILGYDELPKGWICVPHKDICEINPKLQPDKIGENLEVSFLPMKLLEEGTGRFDLSETRKYSEVKKGYTPFIDGDLIFAKITPCMENGKIAVLSNLKNGIGFGSTEFHVSRPTQLINAFYLFYFFLQKSIREDAKRNFTGSAGQLRVPKNYFESIPIPLPPLAEQHRIVAKIEELFSDLEDGIVSLKKAQAQLKTYRQAVLKYAFEGKLTAAWRQQHQPEPAEKLLAQTVRATRRVAPTTANGKTKKPKELPPLTEAELAELPQLPEGWRWNSMINFVDVLSGYAFKSSEFIENGVPAIKISNIGYGEFLWKDQEFLPAGFLKKYKEFVVNPNDLLIALTRPITNNTTKACLFPADQNPALLNQRVAVIKNKYAIELRYLFYFFQSTHFKNSIRAKFSETLQPNLSPNDLKMLPIPICSLSEQHQIVQEIESRLSVCDKLEEGLKESLQKAEALRQSILKKAFEGRLAPQDPNDEPAEKLLERIQAAKS